MVGSHHLAREMARQGHQVIHVSSPVSPAHVTQLRTAFSRSKFRCCLEGGRLSNGVIDVVPFSMLPWAAVRNSSILRKIFYSPRRYLKSVLAKHGMDRVDLIIMDEPRLADLCDTLGPCTKIYRPTDLYAEMRGDPTFTSIERDIVDSGNFSIVAMSQPIADHLRRLGAEHVSVMQNGVDYTFFSTPQDLPETITLPGRPLAVYVGALDDRFSMEHVVAAAKLNPDIEFVLFGPTNPSISNGILDLQNIALMGAANYDQLPSILQRAQVALLPLSNHPANAGRSPMKIYEYAAAGLPVVATKTPELAARNLPFLKLSNSTSEFAEMVRSCVSEGVTSDSCQAIQLIAATQSWPEKARQLLQAAATRITK